MKVNSSVSISNEELEALEITDIAELEIGFQVKTSDYQDYLTIGPVFFELGLHGTESGRMRSYGDQHQSNGGRAGTGSLWNRRDL